MAGSHLGFIGVGRMGGLMAGRLLDAGHSLTVFDTSAAAVAALTARGAKAAASPAAVGDAAEIVFASLPTPPIVQKATLGEGGLIHGSKVKTFIDVSTTGPRVASAVAQGLGGEEASPRSIARSAAVWRARATARWPSWSPARGRTMTSWSRS